MSTVVEEATVTQPSTGDFDAIAHAACKVCFPRAEPGIVAFCGKVLLGIPVRPQDTLCVVCVDLRKSGCPNCGSSWSLYARP